MDLRDAIQKAAQILDQERVVPTVGYEAVTPDPVMSVLSAVVGPLNERGKRFRAIQEHPEKFQFKSLNFELPCALLDQVPAQDRPAWLASLRSRITNAQSYRHGPEKCWGQDNGSAARPNYRLLRNSLFAEETSSPLSSLSVKQPPAPV